MVNTDDPAAREPFDADAHSRLLDVIDQAVVGVSRSGVIETWNRAAVALLGWQRSQAVGRDLIELLVPEDQRARAAEIQATLARGDPWSGELRLRRGNGAETLVQLVHRPLLDDDKAVTGSAMVATPVSELRRMEHELHQSSLSEDEFVGVAAHELLSSLTSVSGFALRLRTASESPDSPLATHAEEIDWLMKGVDRLRHTVDLLLKVSSLDHEDAGTASLELFDLAALTRSIVRAAARRTSGVSWQLRIPDSAVSVRASEDAVSHVVRNLVDNAVKYAGDPARVEVRVESVGNQVQVAVRDNGPGVDEQERTRIFERYYRGAAAAGHEGLGLGLYISRELARRQGGDLDLVPSGGGGAEFALTLPSATRPGPVEAEGASPT